MYGVCLCMCMKWAYWCSAVCIVANDSVVAHIRRIVGVDARKNWNSRNKIQFIYIILYSIITIDIYYMIMWALHVQCKIWDIAVGNWQYGGHNEFKVLIYIIIVVGCLND